MKVTIEFNTEYPAGTVVRYNGEIQHEVTGLHLEISNTGVKDFRVMRAGHGHSYVENITDEGMRVPEGVR